MTGRNECCLFGPSIVILSQENQANRSSPGIFLCPHGVLLHRDASEGPAMPSLLGLKSLQSDFICGLAIPGWAPGQPYRRIRDGLKPKTFAKDSSGAQGELIGCLLWTIIRGDQRANQQLEISISKFYADQWYRPRPRALKLRALFMRGNFNCLNERDLA